MGVLRGVFRNSHKADCDSPKEKVVPAHEYLAPSHRLDFDEYFSRASCSATAEVQPLWDELSARWSAGDSEGAGETAGKLIEALTPVAADFSLGIQMNSALHSRALLRYNIGDFAEAEADLLASVAQARATLPPAGLPDQSIPAMMVMVDDRVRISLRGLVNFYLAAGDLERATKAFEEAIAIVPLWKKQAQDNPAIS